MLCHPQGSGYGWKALLNVWEGSRVPGKTAEDWLGVGKWPGKRWRGMHMAGNLKWEQSVQGRVRARGCYSFLKLAFFSYCPRGSGSCWRISAGVQCPASLADQTRVAGPEWTLPESKPWAGRDAEAQRPHGHLQDIKAAAWWRSAAKASKGFGAGLEIGGKLSICCPALATADCFAGCKMDPAEANRPPSLIAQGLSDPFHQPDARATVCAFSFCLGRDAINTRAGAGLRNQPGRAAASAEKADWQCSKHIGA